MVRIVAGWFEDQVAAQRALESLRTAGVESDELFTFVVIRRVCTMACRLVATKWPIRQARAAEVGALCDAARHPSYPT